MRPHNRGDSTRGGHRPSHQRRKDSRLQADSDSLVMAISDGLFRRLKTPKDRQEITSRKFGQKVNEVVERNGRPGRTRTSDLFRVNLPRIQKRKDLDRIEHTLNMCK